MPPSKHVSLLLIHGDEAFLVDRAVREWRAQSRALQLDVEVFDAPSRLLDLGRSVSEMPLIDPERAILVSDPPQLSGAARRGAGSAEELAALLGERAPTTAICLVAHGRVPPQNPVLAGVKTLGGSIVYFAPLRGRELRTWLEGEASRRRLRLPPGALEHLLQVTGGDLGALSAELDKLSALGQGAPLTPEDLVAVVAGDEPVEMWKVLEELLGSTPARGAATLDRLLADGRSAQHLLAVLGGQVRDLLLVQALLHLQGSAAGLASALRMPEWRAERLARQARSVPPGVVASWLHGLHEADRGVKAGEIGDLDAVRILTLRAAASVTAARGA